MLDYIIDIKTLLIAGAIGGVSGYLVSYLIDNYFLEPQTDADAETQTQTEVQTIDSSYQKIVNVILWGIALICIWGAIFTAAAAIDYFLSFAPISHGMKFMENDSALTEFTWGFFAGMITTLLRFGELAFEYFKKD